ncbi:MAG TPA: hypothetical protein PKK96_06010 [Anaerolineales bacterium]|nr:hypothetical protein [Anaerolineales bacterium]HMR98278.1 hypothetical protein [Anaerolineales bacterium]HNQ94814.1 hypothetical protein [Anaerolineales bacterium]HNS60541.1 hypothetical protein [Anaerolineales bacterium]
MFDNSVLFPSLPSVSPTEILIVLTIASLAYFVVFTKFEKHVPMQRRIVKLFIVVGTLSIIGILFSRYTFWGMIGLMTIGQVYLHGVYFPKHGINGLTAEPYVKYLELTERMKGKKP